MVGEFFVDSGVFVPEVLRRWFRLDAVDVNQLWHGNWGMTAFFPAVGNYVDAESIRTGITICTALAKARHFLEVDVVLMVLLGRDVCDRVLLISEFEEGRVVRDFGRLKRCSMRARYIFLM